jgi:MFS family permease
MFLTNPFWSLYVLELGASISDLGFFSLLTGLLPAVFIAPVGYLGDRMSRKKLIIIGSLLSSFGPLLNAFATNWVQLIPGTLIGSHIQSCDTGVCSGRHIVVRERESVCHAIHVADDSWDVYAYRGGYFFRYDGIRDGDAIHVISERGTAVSYGSANYKIP